MARGSDLGMNKPAARAQDGPVWIPSKRGRKFDTRAPESFAPRFPFLLFSSTSPHHHQHGAFRNDRCERH